MQLESLKTKEIGKHNTIEELSVSEKQEVIGKKVLGNIRNPWDWYVSLWAFGCMGKGGLYKNFPEAPNKYSVNGWKEMLRRLRNNEQINIDKNKIYANSDDPEGFRIWVKSILKRKVDFGESYKRNEISKNIGLLTYRYLMLFTKNGVEAVKHLNSYKEVVEHEKRNKLLDVVIRNESIESDLLRNSSKLGISKSELELLIQNFTKRTNSSKRNDYRHYYDDESRELVYQKERFIVDKYGYHYD